MESMILTQKNADAVKFNSLSYDEVFEKDLKVMDMTAFYPK